MPMQRRPRVAVVGAGPYGLAAAAHLRGEGVEPLVFGEPMGFWERSMPVGMLLRSTKRASSISDPNRALTLDHYEAVRGARLSHPLTLADFIAYGHWFQQQVADVDRRRVVRIDPTASGFRLRLEDGEQLEVGRVIVATGIAPFAWSPEQFAGLPPTLVSHSAGLHEVRAFAGQRVLVVGGGQSALESAALLHEAGASVEIVARAARLRFLSAEQQNDGPAKRWGRALMYYPRTDLGPPGLNWIVGMPDVFRRMPQGMQPQIARRCNFPVGAWWLRPRLEGVPVTTGRNVASTTPTDGRLRVTLDDGTWREVDHAVVATGYRVDVRRYDFLGPDLLRSLSIVDGYPRLSTGLEASIPGLHFLGAPASLSFGPVTRFVTGSWYCARAVTRRIVGKPPLALGFAW